MWTRSTSANGTARTSPHGGFAAWFSFSSSLVVNGSVHKSSRVRTASGVTPAAFGQEAVRLRRLPVRQAHLALERSPHRPHADLQRRLVLVVPEGLELFAAGDRLLELLGVEKGVPDLRARRRDVVGAFELHPLSSVGPPFIGGGAGSLTQLADRGVHAREALPDGPVAGLVR